MHSARRAVPFQPTKSAFAAVYGALALVTAGQVHGVQPVEVQRLSFGCAHATLATVQERLLDQRPLSQLIASARKQVLPVSLSVSLSVFLLLRA